VADVGPLKGIRYVQGRTRAIGPLLAPPYDVVTAHGPIDQFSIARIEHVDPDSSDDPHAHAADLYRQWLARGILAADATPAVYIHIHEFEHEGTTVRRRGLLARVRLEDWERRVVLPHEATNPGPREERFQRLRAVRANLSPLYLLFQDREQEVNAAVWNRLGDDGAWEQDRAGARHRIIPLHDLATQTWLAEFFQPRELLVADGHHRYEAALAYRDDMRRRHPGSDGPWEYVLALLASASEPGVIVKSTHRVLPGIDGLKADEILSLLQRWFQVAPLSDENRNVAHFRVALANRGEWAVGALPGSPHKALMPMDRGAAWKQLPVAVIEGILDSVLGSRRTPERVVPVVGESDAIRRVVQGEAVAAFLLPQLELSQVFDVARDGDRLPPKSTWFEPKAPAGLVINDFELSTP
jgi:uncharacterized protein (DUF1015 family)